MIMYITVMVMTILMVIDRIACDDDDYLKRSAESNERRRGDRNKVLQNAASF